jgi:integrase
LPSEISALRWKDVDLEKKALHVFVPKTEHHSRGGRRICPLFPELTPYFDKVRPVVAHPERYVIMKHRGSAVNLRTALMRQIAAAGLVCWPKLFQNLRANALTDLAELHPIHTVCRWLGNTVEVAMRHYLIIKQREYLGPGSTPNPK